MRRESKPTDFKLAVIKGYGGHCECCNEERPELLTIDHINGKGSQHRRQLKQNKKKLYAWIIFNRFPGFLRLLCFNCNMSRGIYGYCPHDRERFLS